MLLPHHLDRQPGHVEALPGAYDGDALGDVGRLLAQQPGHRLDRPDRRVGAAQQVGVDVVGVLVGDEDAGGAVERLGLAEDPGIEDDDRPVVLDAHAGVTELRDPHPATVGRSARCGDLVRDAAVRCGGFRRRKLWCGRPRVQWGNDNRTRPIERTHVWTPRPGRKPARAADARLDDPGHADQLVERRHQRLHLDLRQRASGQDPGQAGGPAPDRRPGQAPAVGQLGQGRPDRHRQARQGRSHRRPAGQEGQQVEDGQEDQAQQARVAPSSAPRSPRAARR